MSIAIVTGAIAPYTHRLYDAVAAEIDEPLTVMTCSAIEPQRKWSLPEPEHYEWITLPGLRRHRSYTSHVYVNPAVVRELARRKPKAILVSGFSPTMMMAGAYAAARGIPLGIMTDGSIETDPGAHSRLHRIMRQLLVPRGAFGICASEDSARLLALYGLAREKSHVVPIVSGWDGPEQFRSFDERPFDLHFCGSIDDHRKGARFFAEVVERLAAGGRRLNVRVSGDGPLRGELEARLNTAGARAQFDGFLQQHQLAEAYSSARIFCFPSREEPWGLVANEAILCGTPVVASVHTTSGRELVGPFGAGLVRRLDVATWSREIVSLLDDRERWESFQANHRRAAGWFSLERSRGLMVRAIAQAIGGERSAPSPDGLALGTA